MVEKTLKEKLKRIFDFKKVSFDDPGDVHEQECLFIEIHSDRASITDGLENHMVRGSCKVYSPKEKLPLGYFMKKIRNADQADTKDLFFSNIEESTRMYRDIDARGFDFIYFFSGQFDPEVGTINSIDMEETES